MLFMSDQDSMKLFYPAMGRPLSDRVASQIREGDIKATIRIAYIRFYMPSISPLSFFLISIQSQYL
jgi:hypothetical protein